MSNPVLNQRSIQSQGWAPPAVTPSLRAESTVGPRSRDVMTINGVVGKTAALLGLMIATAIVTWSFTPGAQTVDGVTQMSLSPLVTVGLLVGFGLTVLLYFKPGLAPIIAPLYALVSGFFVGALSKYYEAFYDGIVLQAVGATLAVAATVLVLYATRVIRVTQRMRSIIMSATIGLMVFYGLSFVVGLFGVRVPFLYSSSLIGIGFSVLVCFLAAANLLLDFDLIERGAAARFNKDFEWYAAFGLLVTLVWLYLEILRLLAKLRSR